MKDPTAVQTIVALLKRVPALMQEEKYESAEIAWNLACEKTRQLDSEGLASQKMLGALQEKMMEAGMVLRFYPLVVSCRKMRIPLFLPALELFSATEKETIKKGLVSGLATLKQMAKEPELRKDPRIAKFCDNRLREIEKMVKNITEKL